MNKNVLIDYSTLTQKYSTKDWFSHVDIDHLQRFVIYVKFMNEETMAIPDKCDGRRVVVTFAVSDPKVLKAKYGTPKTLGELHLGTYSPPFAVSKVKEEEDFMEESDIDDLIFELDRLEKLCGSKALQDIFYEVHDKKNAVTDVSGKYPYVRSCMDKLYNNFGFDVIYEELDG